MSWPTVLLIHLARVYGVYGGYAVPLVIQWWCDIKTVLSNLASVIMALGFQVTNILIKSVLNILQLSEVVCDCAAITVR